MQQKLEKLLAFVDSKEVAAKLEEIKHENKLVLKEYLKETQGIELDEIVLSIHKSRDSMSINVNK